MSAEDAVLTEALDRSYRRKKRQIATELRRLADALDPERPPRKNLKDGKPDYLADAREAIHRITWDVANLGIEDLVARAGDAHLAARGALP